MNSFLSTKGSTMRVSCLVLFIQSILGYFVISKDYSFLPPLNNNITQFSPLIQRSLYYQRVIWVLWWQGLTRAPPIVQRCYESWITFHDTPIASTSSDLIPWRIIELNRTNIQQFVNVQHYLPNISNYSMGIAHRSDLIRMILLREYGGVWVDATLLCNLPLDYWLPLAANNTGFFVFSRPRSTSLLSNWFIYATKRNYMIERWLETYLQYWQKYQRALSYFNHHETFSSTYKADPRFRAIFTQMIDLSAKKPHVLLYNKGLMKVQILQILNHSWIPVFKLTYRNLSLTLEHITQMNISQIIRKIRIAKPLHHRVVSLV